jgi:hydrogenase nickel incorporation protein HypA/HybF
MANPMFRAVHELALAQSILELVEQQATANNACRVESILLHIGELTAVVADSLTFSFEIVAKGTRAENACVEIVTVPWRMRCGSCQHEYRVEQRSIACPKCGALGGETISGRELQLVEMQVE